MFFNLCDLTMRTRWLLLVGGSVVVEAGEMRTVDSESLARHARDSARELARRAGVSSAG